MDWDEDRERNEGNVLENLGVGGIGGGGGGGGGENGFMESLNKECRVLISDGWGNE